MQGTAAVLAGLSNRTPLPSAFLRLPAWWYWPAKTGCVDIGDETGRLLPSSTVRETQGAPAWECLAGNHCAFAHFPGVLALKI